MFHTTGTNLMTSKNTFNKAMGNYATNTLQIDKNFTELEYKSKTIQQ